MNIQGDRNDRVDKSDNVMRHGKKTIILVQKSIKMTTVIGCK